MELDQLIHKPVLFIQKHHPELYQQVLDYCTENKIEIKNNNFKQKLFHFYYKINKQPTCKVCKTNIPAFESFNVGYKVYCSCKCRANDPEWEKKKKSTVRQKYGVDNVSQLSEIKLKKEITTEKHFGTKYCSRANKKKKIETNIKKYGVANGALSEVIQKRISEGLINANIERGDEIKEKRKKTFKERYNVENPCVFIKNRNASKVEIALREFHNISTIKLKNLEFDLFFEKENTIVEIDGYFHPIKFDNINYHQILHALNDYRKDQLSKKYGYNFYRIRWEIVNELFKRGRIHEITLEFIINNQYHIDRNFEKCSDFITREEILKLKSERSLKDFSFKMVTLMHLLNLIKKIKYETVPEFLLHEYNIIHENKYPSSKKK